MRPVVALTGGIGSGKSTVAECFSRYGIPAIDADTVAHELTAPQGAAIADIVANFGPDYLEASGALDRARMRALIFADPAAKKRLEAILHPKIRAECMRRCEASVAPYTLLMLPLFVEHGGSYPNIARVLVVDCHEETQIRRVMMRSGLLAEEVRAIMATQVARAERLQYADDILWNEGDYDALSSAVSRLHDSYLQLFATGFSKDT